MQELPQPLTNWASLNMDHATGVEHLTTSRTNATPWTLATSRSTHTATRSTVCPRPISQGGTAESTPKPKQGISSLGSRDQLHQPHTRQMLLGLQHQSTQQSLLIHQPPLLRAHPAPRRTTWSANQHLAVTGYQASVGNGFPERSNHWGWTSRHQQPMVPPRV
jgi:hypothetical protein